jgi:hypothetical protein
VSAERIIASALKTAWSAGFVGQSQHDLPDWIASALDALRADQSAVLELLDEQTRADIWALIAFADAPTDQNDPVWQGAERLAALLDGGGS